MPLLTISPTVDSEIASDGFALATISDFPALKPDADDLIAFLKFWDNLVADPYLPEQFGRRYRRHSRFICDNKNLKLCYVPGSSYFQDTTVNPVMGGIERTFSPLEEGAIENSIFQSLIIANSTMFLGSSSRFCNINVHFIRIPCNASTNGYPCPEGIHSDGFKYISISLMKAIHVNGADSTLYEFFGTTVT